MKYLFLILLLSVLNEFGYSKTEVLKNEIFLNRNNVGRNLILNLDSINCRFNKFNLNTYNDSGNSHLNKHTNVEILNNLNATKVFKINDDEYIELWWKVHVDSTASNQIIGFEFSINADYTKVFWDKNLIVSKGKIDVAQDISIPNNIGSNVFPIATGITGWHDLVVRQKYKTDLLDPNNLSLMYFEIHPSYVTYIENKFIDENKFENISLNKGFGYFIFCVFLVSVLFYIIVDQSKSFLWFSAFLLCILLIIYQRYQSISVTGFNYILIQNILLCLTCCSFIAFVFYNFFGKAPKRIYFYFIPFTLLWILPVFPFFSRTMSDYPAVNETKSILGNLLFIGFLVELVVVIVRAIIDRKKRIKIIAFGIIQFIIVVVISDYLPKEYVNKASVVSLYILPISFLVTLIYIVKDSYQANITNQERVLKLTFEKSEILSSQNVNLEKEVRARTMELTKERDLSESLLLNILPSEVAEELKQKGSADAKYFDDVTVMFTDIKGFTQLSEKLSASELVAEIDTCFKAFDQIISLHNIEKIKTIGDSYMCAGGLPVANKTNATDIVCAALEIQQFMKQHLQERIKEGKEPFEIRIGVNTGPVVAGIVGLKKFAYDIWGDTVNIASRMESSGEGGKVNISGSTYNLVKNKFYCTYRGKVQAKNKGEIDMYFVESIL